MTDLPHSPEHRTSDTEQRTSKPWLPRNGFNFRIRGLLFVVRCFPPALSVGLLLANGVDSTLAATVPKALAGFTVTRAAAPDALRFPMWRFPSGLLFVGDQLGIGFLQMRDVVGERILGLAFSTVDPL